MVSLSKVEGAVLATHGSSQEYVRARLQYLNTVLRFPPGLRVGKARKADYGLEEVFAYFLFWSLARAAVPPAVSVGLISRFWPELMRAMLAAGVGGIGVPDGQSGTLAVLSSIEALPSGRDGRALADAFEIRVLPRGGEIADAVERLSGSVILDIRAIHRAMVAGLAVGPGAVSEGEMHAMTLAALSDNGWAQVAGWTLDGDLQSADRHAADGDGSGEPRLGDADYYFRRVVEFVRLLPEGEGALQAPERAERLLTYLLRPMPREQWKRYVEVEGSGVPMLQAIAVLAGGAAHLDCGMLATLEVQAGNRLSDAGFADTRSISGGILDTASRLMDGGPVQKT